MDVDDSTTTTRGRLGLTSRGFCYGGHISSPFITSRNATEKLNSILMPHAPRVATQPSSHSRTVLCDNRYSVAYWLLFLGSRKCQSTAGPWMCFTPSKTKCASRQ
jgi:hypothetical protein